MTHPDSPEVDTRFRLTFTFIVAGFGIFGALDIALDWRESVNRLHLASEAAVVLFAVASVAHLWVGFRSRLQRAQDTIATLESAHREFRKGNEETLKRMRYAITEQFDRWRLTPAEARLAHSLMRGYTIDQIAAVYDRSPNTVRNQTAAIYAKAGMTGRSDLSAFFLADILGDEEAGAP